MSAVLCDTIWAVNKLLIKYTKWAPSTPDFTMWDTSETRQECSKKNPSQNANLMVLCTTHYFFMFFCTFWVLSQFSMQQGRRKTQTLQVSITLRSSRWTGRSNRSNLAPVSLLPVPSKVPPGPHGHLVHLKCPCHTMLPALTTVHRLWFPQECPDRCQELFPCETSTATSLWS